VLELDPRIIRIGIEVEGRIKFYDDLAVTATGTKYANAIQNEVEVRVANLDRTTRDFILTETSPQNLRRTPKRLIVDAGRKSYGTSRIIIGDIISAVPSQPPDIWLTLKALTGNYEAGNIIARTQPPVSPLSTISKQVAEDLGVTLDFQADDVNVANYSFTGGALKQVNKLGDAGNYAAYVDDTTLIVKNRLEPLRGQVKILNVDSGMIGVPEVTPYGVRVKFLLDNVTKLGGALQVQSSINPAANGLYCIYKLGFDIASRDTPFYYVAEAYKI